MPVKLKGPYAELDSATEMPRASAFLWNKNMLVNANCRGYVSSQFMQSEPSKYAYAPNIEAKTFMQPEQAYYAHYPGRFFYIKNEATGELFSLPYEPVRKVADNFVFRASPNAIAWIVSFGKIECRVTLTIPVEDVVEMWELEILNKGDDKLRLSIYPYFTIGYMSWMNQSARYDATLGGIVASAVSPYQKLEDYPEIKRRKDKTFLLHDRNPIAWETHRERFEGEGGLHNPSAIEQEHLSKQDAYYDTPVAVLQYRELLAGGKTCRYQFIFGPAKNSREIAQLRDRYFAPNAFNTFQQGYEAYQKSGVGVLRASSTEQHLDAFVNHWLARQIFYHGDINRLSNDPQTRNYLQDGMGMSYVAPEYTRQTFLHSLAQQHPSGAMPDGILLREGAKLQYINQIPHTDHCLWLPVCLLAYLDETNDYGILDVVVKSESSEVSRRVFDRIGDAVDFLLANRDDRGLSYIAQGDWCDPMNMVGPKGLGVSGWLSIASIYALKIWAEICERFGQREQSSYYHQQAEELTERVNQHLWDGQWYARGITDDGVSFGVASDAEGKIFLNPQSWALMAGCASEEQCEQIIEAVDKHLETPYGVAMLAPAYTKMREDIGRVTQKYPGSAENGSIYNHAMAFYIFALYQYGEANRAFKLLLQMLPGPEKEDYLRRGQLPIYIPNYYRGAYRQIPGMAGRSSHLFNTGTVAWYYRCIIEELYGLKGCPEGLMVSPKFPSHWQTASVERQFRGASFQVKYEVSQNAHSLSVTLDGQLMTDNIIRFTDEKTYQVVVNIPKISR